jgi:Protein of unknown function (DUF3460)
MPYQSELSQFINQLKKNDPLLENRQKEGREIFWDKPPIDLSERERIASCQLPQKSYSYSQEVSPLIKAKDALPSK